jgi:hypothetical protein
MKIQSVYLDTSVIGGCFDHEFSSWSNGLMNDIRNGLFNAATSTAHDIISQRGNNA